MTTTSTEKLLSYLAHAIAPSRHLDEQIHNLFCLPGAAPQYTTSTAACASLIDSKLPGLNYAFTEESSDRVSVSAWFGYPIKEAVTATGNGIALALCGAMVMAGG